MLVACLIIMPYLIRRAATVAVSVYAQYLMGLERMVTRHHLPLSSMRSGCSSAHGVAVYLKNITEMHDSSNASMWLTRTKQCRQCTRVQSTICIYIINITVHKCQTLQQYNCTPYPYGYPYPPITTLHSCPTDHSTSPYRKENGTNTCVLYIHNLFTTLPVLSPLILHQRRLNETISFSWEKYLRPLILGRFSLLLRPHSPIRNIHHRRPWPPHQRDKGVATHMDPFLTSWGQKLHQSDKPMTRPHRTPMYPNVSTPH